MIFLLRQSFRQYIISFATQFLKKKQSENLSYLCLKLVSDKKTTSKEYVETYMYRKYRLVSYNEPWCNNHKKRKTS